MAPGCHGLRVRALLDHLSRLGIIKRNGIDCMDLSISVAPLGDVMTLLLLPS
jgi:hypothetical protein